MIAFSTLKIVNKKDAKIFHFDLVE